MTRRQHSRSVDSLTAAFVERLFQAVERTIQARTQLLTAEWIDAAMAAPIHSEPVTIRPRRPTPLPQASPVPVDDDAAVPTPVTETTNGPPGMARPRRKRIGPRVKMATTAAGEPPRSALPSPEQQRRDSEFAHLRALLKPLGQGDPSEVRDTPHAAAPLTVVDPPVDPLRLLEAEVRDQAQGLAQLPAASCTARIAAWAGRARSYEETNGSRVAAELLLEKLRVLARAMDAGRIEALNHSWRTTDWPAYIRTNEALAEDALPGRQHRSEPQSDPVRSDALEYNDVWSQPS